MPSSRASATACRAGAAEGEQHEIARIMPLRHGDQADRAGHLVVGDSHDRLRGRDRIEAEVPADLVLQHVADPRPIGGAPAMPVSAAGLSRPSTRLASVMVGWVPPPP